MSRIRTIKPEFWTDDLICSLKLCERLLFIASWNLADDEGRLVWAGPQLKGAVFSTDDDISIADVERMMKSLERADLVVAYVGGRSKQRLGFIRNFRKHQKINRPQPSRHPSPPTEPDQTSTETNSSEPNQVVVNDSLNDSVNGSVAEGKGKEGEGIEDPSASALGGNPIPKSHDPPNNVVPLQVVPDPAAMEREVFRKGKAVLGENAGGLIAKLWVHVDRNPERALKAIDQAAGKYDPREWLSSRINTANPSRAGPAARQEKRNPFFAAIERDAIG